MVGFFARFPAPLTEKIWILSLFSTFFTDFSTACRVSCEKNIHQSFDKKIVFFHMKRRFFTNFRPFCTGKSSPFFEGVRACHYTSCVKPFFEKKRKIFFCFRVL